MSRVEKLYTALDALVEEYKELLIKELEKEDQSTYLRKCRDDEYDGRAYTMHSKIGSEDANVILFAEKQIRQLCEKLNEPLPLPLQALDEYVNTYQNLKAGRTDRVGVRDDIQGEDKRLRKRIIQKLQGKPKPTDG